MEERKREEKGRTGEMRREFLRIESVDTDSKLTSLSCFYYYLILKCQFELGGYGKNSFNLNLYHRKGSPDHQNLG